MLPPKPARQRLPIVLILVLLLLIGGVVALTVLSEHNATVADHDHDGDGVSDH